MDRRKLLLSFVALSPCFGNVQAAQLPALAHIPEAQRVGSGRLVILMVPVLDATLYGPQGHWRDDLPFALKLDYLRPLEGTGMARRVTSEMRGLGFEDEQRLKTWQFQMATIFPDVRKGDTMTALRDLNGATLFFKGDRQIGAIDDREFSKLFFDICLSPKTSQPDLRRRLLGTG